MLKLKKTLAAAIAAAIMSVTIPGVANAATVYYKGSAVYWNYGRTLTQFYGFSEVQSSVYKHSATVNGKVVVKPRTQVAYAEKYVGTTTVQAYWNCFG